MSLMYLMAAGLGVTNAVLLLIFTKQFNFTTSDASVWGQLGDFVGGLINPWVGLFTIFLLLSTLRLQQQELSETRAEMARQRGEMEQQRGETANQNKILALQAFEQTFFSWQSALGDVVRELRYEVAVGNGIESKTISVDGRIALGARLARVIIGKLYRSRDGLLSTITKAKLEDPNDAAAAVERWAHLWAQACRDDADDVAVYFRTLYGLLRWVDKSPTLSDEEKRHYASIVKARLSNTELRAIVLNALTPAGEPFQPLMLKYGLLNNLPANERDICVALFEKRRDEALAA